MSKKSRQKTGYQVTNWSAYNKSLVNRGDITFWFSEEVLSNWEHENKGFKVGRPFVYSNARRPTDPGNRRLCCNHACEPGSVEPKGESPSRLNPAKM